MKRILVSIPTARMIRFFLDTSIFDDLCKEDIEVLVVHNQKSIGTLIKKYKSVKEISFPQKQKISLLNTFLRKYVNVPSIANRFFTTGRIGFHNFFLREKGILQKLKVWIKIIAALFIYNIPVYGKKMFRNSFDDINFKKFLIDNKIDGLVLTCPVIEEERIFAQVANEMSIPIIMGVDGWDILINYGFVHKYNGLMVWGKEMAEHAKVLGFSESQIIYTGIPYKDRFLQVLNTSDRNLIKKKYGIQESDKVILMFGGSWYATGDVEKVNVENLVNAMDNNDIQDTKVIFRMFPRKDEGTEEKYYMETYKGKDNIVFQRPDISFTETTSEIVSENAFKEVAELFMISDVIINILSMCFLEGAILNVPSIICNYKDVYYPTRYVTNSSLYKNLVKYGLIEVSNSNELLSAVNDIFTKKIDYNSNEIIENWNKEDRNVGVKIINTMFGVDRDEY